MTTPVSKVVNVTILTSPTFPKRKGFGLLNIIGASANLPIGDRLRFYADMDAVAADFSGTDEEYLAAQSFFSQKPRPTEIAISRRFASAAPGELLGGFGIETDIDTWNAIDDGAFTIAIDATSEDLTALDFSGAANLDAVAAIIETALDGVFTGATCIYTGNRFLVRSGTTGINSSVSFGTAPGSGTNIAALAAIDAAGEGIRTAGAAIETIEESLQALQDFDPSWYGVTFTKEASEAELKLAAAWVEARVKVFGFTTASSAVADSAQKNDIASYMKGKAYDRTFYQWSLTDPYAIVSAMARAFVVNFNGQDTTITLKFKLEPGVTPSDISESQRLALISKNCNYYTYFGESAMLAEGVMASGQFFDERHGLDWLQNTVENNVFGYLYTRTTKVPQTDKGVASLSQQVDKGMNEGVRNGLLAPGTWNGADLGEVSEGDFLPKGYYVYAQKVADQNQAYREARKAPPIQAIGKGAGAIHNVDVAITFER